VTGNIFNRRSFIKKTAAGAIGIGLTANETFSLSDHTYNLPKIKEYRRMGRTNAMVSDIGSGIPYSENVLKAVIDSGVNFIETAESYDNGRNETLIGNAMKGFEREKLFITTKVNLSTGLATSTDDIVRSAEGSLRRLDTPYVDLYMMHQAQSIVKVADKSFHKACDKLKKEGKIRYRGLSCHGTFWWQEQGGSLEDILMAAIEDGRYDVLFFPYNFLDPGMGERIIRVCKANDIGTMIMKSNPVGVLEDYERILQRGDKLDVFEQKDYERKRDQLEKASGFLSSYRLSDMEELKKAAYRYILSNQGVGTICCRFRTYSDIEFFAGISGTRLDPSSDKLLSDFRESLGFLNCRIGCNICEKSCPGHIPVNTIMRYYYYAQTLKETGSASGYYRNLKIVNKSACNNCQGFCEKSCPHKVAVKTLLNEADRSLT